MERREIKIPKRLGEFSKRLKHNFPRTRKLQKRRTEETQLGSEDWKVVLKLFKRWQFQRRKNSQIGNNRPDERTRDKKPNNLPTEGRHQESWKDAVKIKSQPGNPDHRRGGHRWGWLSEGENLTPRRKPEVKREEFRNMPINETTRTRIQLS